jgi:hypothetical protein
MPTRPIVAHVINAVALLALGAWGYLGSANPSPTALIPVGAGVALLALTWGFRSGNVIAVHTAVLLAALLVIALVMPLRGALGRDDVGAAARVAVMMATGLWAVAMFVRSFVVARQMRNTA